MAEKDPLRELFDSLIDDEIERKVIEMVLKGNKADEIIDSLLNDEVAGDR